MVTGLLKTGWHNFNLRAGFKFMMKGILDGELGNNAQMFLPQLRIGRLRLFQVLLYVPCLMLAVA
jgi:hypothetical protein